MSPMEIWFSILSANALLELFAEMSELIADRNLILFFLGIGVVRTVRANSPPVLIDVDGQVGVLAKVFVFLEKVSVRTVVFVVELFITKFSRGV